MTLDTAIHKLRGFYQENKRLPSYSEMCLLFHFSSKKASFDMAKKLIAAGVIAKDATGRLIPKDLTFRLPVLGVIKAGYPTTAEQFFWGSLSLEQYIVRNPQKSYVLRVSGDSMIDAGICDGDFVIVEKNPSSDNGGAGPCDGDIVVAEIDGDFTLKYFHKRTDVVFLRAANSKYPDLYPRENLQIAGIVVSVIRRY
jgi:SOS regulatory protein LexA